ncbi:MAG: hypothetical protein R8M45_09160 [Ghiorsea sp.]
MRIFIFLFIFVLSGQAYAFEVTPNHAYAEAKRIESDVDKLRAVYGITSDAPLRQFHVQFQARHVWQKTYEILEKINIYRRLEAYPVINANAMEPLKKFPIKLVYDQTRRILIELELIKVRKGITAPPVARKVYQGKTPQDVYQLLDKISRDMDLITGQGFTPSHVFAQALRINSDIELILDHLGIQDRSIPPVKMKNTTPAQVHALAIQMLHEVSSLQRRFSLDGTDFSSLKATQRSRPSDVFATIGLISAELQSIKYNISLKNHIAPPAKSFRNKTPDDVYQLLGWVFDKTKQIKPSLLAR